MMLTVVSPSTTIIHREVVKVTAEAPNGSFCLLPRHVDFVASLIPGILAAASPDGQELFLAVDEGVLVKRGAEVLVSTRNSVQGPLGELRRAVQEQFRELGDREQKARSALGKLEASLVKQVLDWEERSHA